MSVQCHIAQAIEVLCICRGSAQVTASRYLFLYVWASALRDSLPITALQAASHVYTFLGIGKVFMDVFLQLEMIE